MITKLLINPTDDQIAAKLLEDTYRKNLIIIDDRIKNILRICGINVPRDFTPDRSCCHIHLDYPDENLFAIAFEKYFYPHGLMQGGYYWTTEEEYLKQPTRLERINHIFSLSRH